MSAMRRSGWFGVAAAIVALISCGGSDDGDLYGGSAGSGDEDASGAADGSSGTSGGGGQSAGGSAGTSSSGASGAMPDASAGSAGVGGGAGNAGEAGASGGAGAGGAAGSGGTGPAGAGGAAGSTGGSAGAAGAPGQGQIFCQGAMCTIPSQICCIGFPIGGCIPSFPSTCVAGVQINCDDSNDCPAGQLCCAAHGIGMSVANASCQSSCNNGTVLCTGSTNCPAGTSCKNFERLDGYKACQ